MKNVWVLVFCCALHLRAMGNDPAELIGTWIGCTSGGEYLELHFMPTEFMACREFSLQSAFIAPYSIHNDNLHYFDHTVESHLTEMITLNDDMLRLIDSNNMVSELKKISSTPLYPMHRELDYDKELQRIPKKHYDLMFIKRKSDFYCEL